MSTEENLEKEDSLNEAAGGDPLAVGAETGELTAEDAGAGKKTLGLERWVQLVFVVTALLLVWLYDNIINSVWYLFADPSESMVTALAVLAGTVTSAVLYRHKASNALTHDVVEELSKVTWPTRKETSSSTVVVVVASVIAAFVLFMFDTVWSAVTDLVYKV
jgi:preprotein translocase subunit SecE